METPSQDKPPEENLVQIWFEMNGNILRTQEKIHNGQTMANMTMLISAVIFVVLMTMFVYALVTITPKHSHEQGKDSSHAALHSTR